MEFPTRNKEVGGWKEAIQTKGKRVEELFKANQRANPLEIRQMHMPNVIIYWPTENLPVTMIIYNLIKRT